MHAHRKPACIKLSESVISILLNEIPKEKDPSAPLITCDIGGMIFSSLCYIQVQV